MSLPTLPGKADGIVDWNPITLQCRRCTRVRVSVSPTENSTPNLAVILSGSRFHTCPDGELEGLRLCPACWQQVLAACPMSHGSWTSRPLDAAGIARYEREWRPAS